MARSTKPKKGRTELRIKVNVPKAENEPKVPTIDLEDLLKNVGKRLFDAETRIETLFTFLIEEKVVSRDKLQKIATLIEDHRTLQRLEGLSNEETYKRRINAYKEMFEEKEP